LTFWSENFDGGVYVDDDRVEIGGLSADVWYDVQLSLDDTDQQVSGAYRVSGTSSWTPLGVLAYADGFQPNYLGLSALRSGYLDDIDIVGGGNLTDDSCRYVWVWSEVQSFFIKGGPAGDPLVPDYAAVDESGDPAQLTEPGTVDNALRSRYYGVPQFVIDAIDQGKAQAFEE
jgi:hypothetical protein